jgi:hypothetical protein
MYTRAAARANPGQALVNNPHTTSQPTGVAGLLTNLTALEAERLLNSLLYDDYRDRPRPPPPNGT